MAKKRLLRIKNIILLAGFVLLFITYTKINPFDITGRAILDSKTPEETTGKEPIILFCPRDDCGRNLEYLIDSSEEIHCAFFDLDIPEVINALERKKARVIVDADNYNLVEGKITNLKKDTRSAFMHNKFCIFDDNIVWTGSMNPTYNGDEKNNNNVVVYYSRLLAENYEAEFTEMWNGEFGKGPRVKNSKVLLDGILVENYFCPEDFCADKALKALGQANESIYFMAFSFTHDQIGDLLVEKFEQGTDVRGVFEKRQNSQYSEFEKLNGSGIPVLWDNNKAAMHHKVFIMDNRTVITGSMNPTVSGDTRNDENILIIHNEMVAGKFLQEFRNIYGQA